MAERLLWAPWRMEYIRRAESSARGGSARAEGPGAPRSGGSAAGRAAKDAPAGPRCLFCRVGGSTEDRRNLVVARHGRAFLMLNRFPYNPAHVMVAVTRHNGRFAGLTSDERDDLMQMVAFAERALAAEYRPHGVNVGANLGRVAGAGVVGHLHVHLVPRWNGDTNFMPTIAQTKVLPESLARTWSRLRAAVRALDPAPRAAVTRRRAPRAR